MQAGASSVSANTFASSTAANNLAVNRAALARSHPNLSIGDVPHDVEWVFARDRALTFRDADRIWLTGCSLPRRAAIEMMGKLNVAGPVACFLAPTHAAQIRVALDLLRPEQAIIAILPNADQLATLLACDAFADDMARHRLWLVTGEGWADDLKQLFGDTPGLCTPTQFIRLPIVDDAVIEQLIPAAQKVFADVNADRAANIRRLKESYTRRSTRLCVIAPSRFRLWDDAGDALAKLLHGPDVIRVDLDDPSQASTLALAERSHDCGAIVAANIARTDLSNVLSESIPWITWASDVRIPARGACERDRLITARPKLAQNAGWRDHQIVQATWPVARGLAIPTAKSQAATLALIADTHPLAAPEDLSEFSSHRVLWALIASNLHDDPFALTDDIDGFLSRRMKKLDIATETLSLARFVNELILPAYQQSLARLLLKHKIPVHLFGAGWDRVPEFAAHASGIIASREQLREIASGHSALVHVWPHLGPHEIDSLGKPVLRRRANHEGALINDARQLLTGRAISAPISAPELTREMVLKLLA